MFYSVDWFVCKVPQHWSAEIPVSDTDMYIREHVSDTDMYIREHVFGEMINV